MSQENVEIARGGYEEFNRTGTLPPELFEPNAEFDATRTLPDVGVLRGRERFLELIRDYSQSFEDFHVDAEEIVDAGNQVVVVVRDGGRLKGSESEIWNRFAHVWTMRSGKVVRWTAYPDREAALEAVGLE